MPNLKPYLDAARKADDEVKRILNEMDTLFNDGTPEGKQKAVALRPMLEQAQNTAKDCNDLYTTMRDASLVNDQMAALFTAPPDPFQTQNGQMDQGPKVINRAGLQALSPFARMEFVKAGGRVIDE